MKTKTELSEAAQNVVENLACRIAERVGGEIEPNHLIPYLPMSLGMIKNCLDGMVDGSSVVSEQEDGQARYTFTTLAGKEKADEALEVSSCIACDAALPKNASLVICSSCSGTLRKELNVLAEVTGWPAEAVYEHEITYVAAGMTPPFYAEALAGHSRYTLRSMKRKLEKMGLDGFIRQNLDSEKGGIVYTFPGIEYPEAWYRENMQVIRGYPVAVMEEVEMKVVRILTALGVLLLGVFGLAFMHVPMPLLLLGYLVVAPIVGLTMWRHRLAPEEV